MRLCSVPVAVAMIFGKTLRGRRVLLRGWQQLHRAAQCRDTDQPYDVASTQLPPRKDYPWNIYTGWSLLHVIAFNPVTFLLGAVFIVPACLISVWQAGVWVTRLFN